MHPMPKPAQPVGVQQWTCANCAHENSSSSSSCQLCFSPAPAPSVVAPVAAQRTPAPPPAQTMRADPPPYVAPSQPRADAPPAYQAPPTPAVVRAESVPRTPASPQVVSPQAAAPAQVRTPVQVVPVAPVQVTPVQVIPVQVAPVQVTPAQAAQPVTLRAESVSSPGKAAPAAPSPGVSGRAKTDMLLANSGLLSSKALVGCKIAGCNNPSFALGLCSEHSKAQKESQLNVAQEESNRARELLTKGEMFIKYSKSKKPHQVFVKLSPDLTLIRWGDQAKMEKSKSSGKKIRIKDTVAVMKGRGSPVFQKYTGPASPDAEFVSFSVMYEEGRNKQSTLDLELPCPDESKSAAYRAISHSWEKALKWAINQSGGVAVANNFAMDKGAGVSDLPPSAEIEARFEKFMDEKCLNAMVRDELRSLHDRSKWEMMLNAEKVDKELSTKQKSEPDYWVTRIHQVFLKKSELEDLKIVLAAAGRTWMAKFAGFSEDDNGEYAVEDLAQKNGILGLLNVMTRHDVHEPEIVFEVLSCLKLLVNNDFGFKLGMLTNNFVPVLCNSLARGTDGCRAVALIILTTIAWDSDKGLSEVLNALEDPGFPVFQDSGVGLKLLVSMISRLDGHGLGNRHASADFPDGKGYLPNQRHKKKGYAGAVALWDLDRKEEVQVEAKKEELHGVYLSLFEMLVEAQKTQFQIEPAEAPGAEPRESVSGNNEDGRNGGAEWKGYRRGAASGRDDIRLKKTAAHVILHLEQKERQLDHQLAAVNERALMFVNTLVNSHNDLDTRVHFRQRLIELGMLEALARVRGFIERAKGELFETLGCGRLELQCDLFEEEMISDAQRTRWNEIDLANAADLFSFIRANCTTRGTTSYLVAMLQALAVLPIDALRSELAWARVCDILEFAVTPIPEPEDLLKDIKVDASEYAVGDDGIRQRNPTYEELKAQLDKMFVLDKQRLHDRILALQNHNAKLIDDVNAANMKVLQMEQNHRKALDQAVKDAALRPWKNAGGPPGAGAPASVLCANCGGVAEPGAAEAPAAAPEAPAAPPEAPEAPAAPGAPDAPPDAPPGPPGAPEGPVNSPSSRSGVLASLPPGLKPKPKVAPTKKMKNLHWAPLKVQKVSGTVFASLDDTSVVFEKSQFESLFCQSASHARKLEKKEKEVKKISFVDGKRGYAVNIALGRIRLPHSTIREYILSMDESWLNEEHTLALLSCMPEPAELERVAQYTGDLALLETVDLFFLGCMRIPNPKVRLECVLLKLRFQQMYDELDQALDLCNSRIESLTDSQELRRTLEIVLSLGNYLNAGTKNGESYGFDINFLLKLDSTKSQPVEGRVITLLEYVVNLCHERNEDVCTFWETMHPSLQAAARIENSWLQGQTSKMRVGLTQVQQELARAENANHAVDRFYPVMSAFYESADPKANRIKRKLLALEHNVATLTKFLGCDAGMDMESLFKLLAQFAQDWVDAQKKIGADEAKKAREEKKKPRKADKPEISESVGKVDAAMSVLRDSNKDDIRSAITKRRNQDAAAAAGRGVPTLSRGVSQAKLKQYKTMSKREGQKLRGGGNLD